MMYTHERTPTEWHTQYIQQHKHNVQMHSYIYISVHSNTYCGTYSHYVGTLQGNLLKLFMNISGVTYLLHGPPQESEPHLEQHTRELISAQNLSSKHNNKDPSHLWQHKFSQMYILWKEVEFMSLYLLHGQLGSLLLCLWDVFQALIKSPVYWFCTSALGLNVSVWAPSRTTMFKNGTVNWAGLTTVFKMAQWIEQV